MPSLRPILVLAALAPLMPVAQAATGSATIEFDSPSRADIIAEATMDGAPASQMRYGIDQSDQGGDQNGEVSQAEVDAFETWILGFFGGFAEGASPTGSLTMDGKDPTEFKISTFDIRDATGPVDSTAPITVRMVFQLTFPVEAGERHTLRSEGDEPSEGEEEDPDGSGFGDFDFGRATLKAPPGYVIESATGLPQGAYVSNDKKSIDLGDSFQPTGDLVIVFVRGGGGAPGFAAVLVFLAVLSVAARRRR